MCGSAGGNVVYQPHLLKGGCLTLAGAAGPADHCFRSKVDGSAGVSVYGSKASCRTLCTEVAAAGKPALGYNYFGPVGEDGTLGRCGTGEGNPDGAAADGSY